MATGASSVPDLAAGSQIRGDQLGHWSERFRKAVQQVHDRRGWRMTVVIRLILMAAAAVLIARLIRGKPRSTYGMIKERSRRNRAFRLRHPSLSA